MVSSDFENEKQPDVVQVLTDEKIFPWTINMTMKTLRTTVQTMLMTTIPRVKETNSTRI